MSKPTTFSIVRDADDHGYDYVIGGIPLKQRIRNHERATVEHQSSLGAVDQARARLLLAADPDLEGGTTALYVCGMCGGYDGGPIGARIRREGERVIWDSMGYHYDYDEEPSLFVKVRSFTFLWAQYEECLLATPAT